VPTKPERLTLEPAYPAAALPMPPTGPERQQFLRELERWNQGGLGASERWHPVSRVVIEMPVIQGKGDAPRLMKHLRAEHYWTARRCYEEQLREHPDLSGRVVLRLTQNARGVVTRAVSLGGKGVPDQRKHKTALKSAAFGACIASAFRGVTLPLARKGGATFSFSVDLYPGDAPLPERDTRPSEGRVDLAEIDLLVAAHAGALGRCFDEGERRHPGHWGRLALRLELGAQGQPEGLVEVESTFPDTETTRCVKERLGALRFPRPQGGTPRLVLPFRWAPPEG